MFHALNPRMGYCKISSIQTRVVKITKAGNFAIALRSVLLGLETMLLSEVSSIIGGCKPIPLNIRGRSIKRDGPEFVCEVFGDGVATVTWEGYRRWTMVMMCCLMRRPKLVHVEYT